MENIDVILTSCNRFDLLERTIESFLRYNTYDINRFIVRDDSDWHDWSPESHNKYNHLVQYYGHDLISFISSSQRFGQIKSLDVLWSFTSAPYVFCMEDDWEFYREGFIEDSLEYLQKNDKCIQLWLREITDTNSHPIEHVDGTMRLKLNHNRTWNGFSFNPGLKRRRDYDLIRSYGQHTTFDPKRPWESEIKIGKLYAELGYWAGIGSQGYVRHIGNARGIRS